MANLTGTQPKKINLEKAVFESCGTFYYINLEAMGYARMKRFFELMPVVIYGRKYTDLVAFIHNLRMKMISGGDDFKKTYFEVASELTSWDQYLLDNAGDYVDSYMDDTLRFCALFCVTKEEDLTAINDIDIEQKVKNWKTDMNLYDFFLLAKSQIPRYKETLTELWEEAKPNKGKLIQRTTPQA